MSAFIDLFSGIGGFALGAHMAGLRFEKHYFSEVDDYAVSVYLKHFPEAVALGDITKIKNIPGLVEKDRVIITGGFPCQDLSIIGKKRGLDAEKSGLYKEYIRIVGEIRPEFILMENVAAVFNFDIGKLFGALSSLGYDCEWKIDWASSYGLPHYRPRFFLCGYPQGIRHERLFNFAKNKNKKVQTILIPERLRFYTSFYNKPLDEMENTSATMADVWGDSDGVSARMDRLRCLGNAVVPQAAAMIFSLPAFDAWRSA